MKPSCLIALVRVLTVHRKMHGIFTQRGPIHIINNLRKRFDAIVWGSQGRITLGQPFPRSLYQE